MYRLYCEYVCPNLKQGIERATKVSWDILKEHGLFPGVNPIISTDKPEDSSLITTDSNPVRNKSGNYAGFSQKRMTTNQILDAIPRFPLPFQLRLAKSLKSIKDIVFFEKSIEVLTEILGRQPTKEELNFAFHGYTPQKDRDSSTYNIWDEYISYKEKFYEKFGQFLYKHANFIAKCRWNVLRRKATQKDRVYEPLRIRLVKGVLDTTLQLSAPNVENVMISNLWDLFNEISLNRLNLINGKIIKFTNFAMYRFAYFEIYHGTGIDIKKILTGKTAKRMMEGLAFKRKMMGFDNKDKIALDEELIEKVAKKMELSVSTIKEAIDYVETPVFDDDDEIPPELRFESPRHMAFYAGAKTFGDLRNVEPNVEEVYDDRNEILLHGLRLLALEAIPDRLGKFVFLGLNGLFISYPKMTLEQMAKQLSMEEKIIDFIHFTGMIRCLIYESARITRKLPSFIKLYRKYQVKLYSLDLPVGSYYTNMSSAEAKRIRMEGLKEFLDMPIVAQINYYRFNRLKIINNMKKSPLTMEVLTDPLEDKTEYFPS